MLTRCLLTLKEGKWSLLGALVRSQRVWIVSNWIHRVSVATAGLSSCNKEAAVFPVTLGSQSVPAAQQRFSCLLSTTLAKLRSITWLNCRPTNYANPETELKLCLVKVKADTRHWHVGVNTTHDRQNNVGKPGTHTDICRGDTSLSLTEQHRPCCVTIPHSHISWAGSSHGTVRKTRPGAD